MPLCFFPNRCIQRIIGIPAELFLISHCRQLCNGVSYVIDRGVQTIISTINHDMQSYPSESEGGRQKETSWRVVKKVVVDENHRKVLKCIHAIYISSPASFLFLQHYFASHHNAGNTHCIPNSMDLGVNHKILCCPSYWMITWPSPDPAIHLIIFRLPRQLIFVDLFLKKVKKKVLFNAKIILQIFLWIIISSLQ